MNDITKDVEQRLAAAFRDLGRIGVASADHYLDAQHAIRAAIGIEADRLEARRGPTDARVKAMRFHLGRRVASTVELSVLTEVTAVNPVPIPKSGGVIEGRVADLGNLGIGGLSVSLVDANGVKISGIGAQSTDSTGYYAFALDAQRLKQLRASQPAGVQVSVSSRGRKLDVSAQPIQLDPDSHQTVNVRLDRFRGAIDQPCPVPDPTLVEVPNVVLSITGNIITLREARELLKRVGLQVGNVEPAQAPDDSTVVDQTPASGSKAAAGSPVDLKVRVPSSPGGTTTVPDLSGLRFTEGRDRLTAANLVVGRVAGDFDNAADVDADAFVQAQSPTQGVEAADKSPVNLLVKKAGSQLPEEGSIESIVELASIRPDFDQIENQPSTLVRKLRDEGIDSVAGLRAALTSSDEELGSRFKLSPIRRARAFRSVFESLLTRG